MAAGLLRAAKPRRTFREFQFIVVPVLLVEDHGSVPVAEAGDEVVCRGLAGLQEFMDSFPAKLAWLNAKGEVTND